MIKAIWMATRGFFSIFAFMSRGWIRPIYLVRGIKQGFEHAYHVFRIYTGK
jgi:hypothetical protein